MRRAAAALVLFGMFCPAGRPAHAAHEVASTDVSPVEFLSPTVGWIAISSSAYYGVACQEAVVRNPACQTAATELLETRNGGQTWQRRLQIIGAPLSAFQSLPQVWIRAFSPSTTLALPLTVPSLVPPHLYTSTDSGLTWITRSIPQPKPITVISPDDITAPEPRHLWLLLRQGATVDSEAVNVFRSKTDGAAWDRIACTAMQVPVTDTLACRFGSGIRIGGLKDSLTFGSVAHGWITSNNAARRPSLYVTYDGGVHWLIQRPPLPRGVLPTSLTAGRVVLAHYLRPVVFGRSIVLPTSVTTCTENAEQSSVCQSRLYALLSFDDGRRWVGSRLIPSNILEPGTGPLQIMSPNMWWSVDATHLWSTTDAGRVWRSKPLVVPGKRTVFLLQFVSHATGWAVAGQLGGQDPYAHDVALLHTTDGGTVWTTARLPSMLPPRSAIG